MEVTGILYKTKFILDEAKRTKAMRHGFSVYTIRSDFTDAQKFSIIEQFINEVKKNGRK